MSTAIHTRTTPELTREPTNPASVSVVLAVTGASGSLFAIQMLRLLDLDGRVDRVHLVVSPSALRVFAEEAGVGGRNSLVEKLLGHSSDKILLLAHEDIGAPIASGSYPVDAMVILPCSMGTLGRIAAGTSDDLIIRAADVILKERRRLIVVPRDMPFNLIHIRNMETITLAGGIICPAVPSFYSQPKTVEEVAMTVVNRVIDLIGLENDGYRWNE